MTKIVTFYTYKGGIGRTMALANAAFRLAIRHGLDVVVIDWDLEAPSLHQFFTAADAAPFSRKGTLDYLLEWRQAERPEDLKRSLTTPEAFEKEFLDDVDLMSLELKSGRLANHNAGRVRIMTASGMTSNYPTRLAELNLRAMEFSQPQGYDWSMLDCSSLGWKELSTPSAGPKTKLMWAVAVLRDLLCKVGADVVLIDSRTGLSDVGYICTKHLPDAIFLLTAPNEQSWGGLASVVNTSLQGGKAGDHQERLTIWLGVSRVPLVGELRSTEEWVGAAGQRFQNGLEKGLWSAEDHPDGLNTFLIPHHGRWTIGENIVWSPEDRPDDYLARAFDRVAETLAVWIRRPLIRSRGSQEEIEEALASTHEELKEAVDRGDHLFSSHLYFLLGSLYCKLKSFESAARFFELSTVLAFGRQDQELLALCLEALGSIERTFKGFGEVVRIPWKDAGYRASVERSLAAAYESKKSRYRQSLDIDDRKRALRARSGLRVPS